MFNGLAISLVFGCCLHGGFTRPTQHQRNSLLRILPNTDEIIVQAGEDVSITCIGDQYLSWEYSTHSYSHPDEVSNDIDNRLIIDSYQNEGIDYPSDYTHISTVRILNTTYLDTGYITCLNEDDEMTRIYIYVRDPSHLWSIIPTPTSSRVLDVIGGTQVTIPCRPTDPHIAVLLKESNVQVYPSHNHRWIAYDPREGFVISGYPFQIDTEFECIAQLPRIGKTETFSFYVRVDQPIAQERLKDSSEEVKFIGHESASLPEASFQDMLPLSISEFVASALTVDRKVEGEIDNDHSNASYLKDNTDNFVTGHLLPHDSTPVPVHDHYDFDNKDFDNFYDISNPENSFDLDRSLYNPVKEQNLAASASDLENIYVKANDFNENLLNNAEIEDKNGKEVSPFLGNQVQGTRNEISNFAFPTLDNEDMSGFQQNIVKHEQTNDIFLTPDKTKIIGLGDPQSLSQNLDFPLASEMSSFINPNSHKEKVSSSLPIDEGSVFDYGDHSFVSNINLEEKRNNTGQQNFIESLSNEEANSEENLYPYDLASEEQTREGEYERHSEFAVTVTESGQERTSPTTELTSSGSVIVSTMSSDDSSVHPINDLSIERTSSLADIENLIIAEEELHTFMGVNATPVSETQPTQADFNHINEEEHEASEPEIVKSYAFTVGAEDEIQETTIRVTTNDPLLEKRGYNSPVENQLSPQSANENCVHQRNSLRGEVPCECPSPLNQRAGNLMSSSNLNTDPQRSTDLNRPSVNSIMTLQPSVRKMGNGSTRMGGRVQFECAIEVSEDFDLILEWSYPQTIKKEKIHVQPQTTKYNGNGMKILRSILTNNNFRRGDEGPYVCMPTISSSRKSTSLTRSDAQEENQIEKGRMKTNEHFSNGSQLNRGPRLVIKEKTRGRRFVGQNFILECSASHTKPETILELIWKIPHAVETSGRSNIISDHKEDGRVISTLTVKNLQLSDKGNYTCIAEEIYPENGVVTSGSKSNMKLY